MKIKTTLELDLVIDWFDNESNEKFISITEKDNSSRVLFSAWLNQKEIHTHWDIIARNITQSFKNELLRELNRPSTET